MSSRPARHDTRNDNGLLSGEPGVAAVETATITIVVNGERRSTRASTLDELLREAGYGCGKVATALNGEFVAARQRSLTRVRDGDQVEIVAPRQGG